MRISRLVPALFLCCLMGWTSLRTAHAQSYGVDLKNTLMPASGAMGGTSVARPQDFVSGINGNAATLTQYRGTNFTVGSAWAEATFNIAIQQLQSSRHALISARRHEAPDV